MDRTKFDELKSKYPTLFESLRYIECHDGWIDLIDELCKDIMKIDRFNLVKFEQVKEKFANLRVYVSFRSSEIESETLKYLQKSVHKLTDKYEKRSAKVCETCGKRGKTVGQGIINNSWLTTVCDECIENDPDKKITRREEE